MAFQNCPRPFLFVSSSRLCQLRVVRRDVIHSPSLALTHQLRAFHSSEFLYAKSSSKSKQKSSTPRKPPTSSRPAPVKATAPSTRTSESRSSASRSPIPNEVKSPQTAASRKYSYAPRTAIDSPEFDPENPSAYFVDPLNAPATTLPPPLDLPPAKEFDGKLKYWLACGKKYLLFYKTGIKALWSNRKILKALGPQPLAVQALLKRQTLLAIEGATWIRPARAFSPITVRPQDGIVDEDTMAFRKLRGNLDFQDCPTAAEMVRKHSTPEERRLIDADKAEQAGLRERNQASAEQLDNPHWRDDYTRAEFQFRRRTARDIRKAIPFGLILVVCGEWTPLIVAFVSSAVPRICWIPAQATAALRKIEKRRAVWHMAMRYAYRLEREDPTGLLNKPGFVAVRLYRELQGAGVMQHVLKNQSLATFLLRERRLGTWVPFLKYLAYLDLDDSLIMRDGGVNKLTVPELHLAAAERAIDVLDRPNGAVARDLERWIEDGGWRSILNHSVRVGPGSELRKD